MPDRKQILSAALDDFVEKGVREVSLESVARRATVETGVVRALFIDIHTLLAALLEECSEPLINAISIAVDEIDDPRELIRKSFLLFEQWLFDNPKSVKLWLRCTLEEVDVLPDVYQKSLLPSDFYDRLNDFIMQGRLRCQDLLIFTVIFESLAMYPHIMRPALEQISGTEATEQFLDRRLQAVFDLFENGLFAK
jgi:AcrR family transcriptional regulator